MRNFDSINSRFTILICYNIELKRTFNKKYVKKPFLVQNVLT